MKRNSILLLCVAFCEGAVVMAAEIAAAKLIAPWFGSSLYVWSAVLGVTMGGLALGYFGGGALSARRNPGLVLAWIMALAGGFVVLMPLTGPAIMSATLLWDPRWGTLFSCVVFLFPPILLLGMVSPLLVALSRMTEAGKAAGTIYGTSTVGGIAMTFAMGYWLMPAFGLRLPLMVLGGVLAVMAVAMFTAYRKPIGSIAAVVLLGLALSSSTFARMGIAPLREGKSVFQEHGWMGEVDVREAALIRGSGIVGNEKDLHIPGYMLERTAYINGREQTRMRISPDGSCSLHPYVPVMTRLAALQPPHARTLLLGMGGGSLLRELVVLGHEVEACEIDARMIRLAEDYFECPTDSAQVRAEDARLCINRMQGDYDLVLVDVFWGQQGPSHVMTLESLAQIHRHLRMKGMLAVLFPGPLEGAHAQGLVRTMREAGFQVSLALPDGLGSTGLVVVGTHLPYSPQHFHPQGSTKCVEASGIPAFVPGKGLEASESAAIYRDDRPQLEALFAPLGRRGR
jgi:predicted membrane-bound spermidine synthase